MAGSIGAAFSTNAFTPTTSPSATATSPTSRDWPAGRHGHEVTAVASKAAMATTIPSCVFRRTEVWPRQAQDPSHLDARPRQRQQVAALCRLRWVLVVRDFHPVHAPASRFDVNSVCRHLSPPTLICYAIGNSPWHALNGGAVVPWPSWTLNPDEAVAAGWLRRGGLAERILSKLQNWSFSRAARIVVLDRFMAQRLEAKGVPSSLLHIDPPWSYEGSVRHDVAARDAFRAEHRGKTGKFVLMYFRRHSTGPCHPLRHRPHRCCTSASRAAIRFQTFNFSSAEDGSEHPKVQSFRRAATAISKIQILCLPYHATGKTLARSLFSADLQPRRYGAILSSGIVHPCTDLQHSGFSGCAFHR